MANFILLENGDFIEKEDSSGRLLLENQGGVNPGVLDQSGTTGTLIGEPSLGSGGGTIGY